MARLHSLYGWVAVHHTYTHIPHLFYSFTYFSPGDLLDSVIKPGSPALAGKFFTTEPTGKPCNEYRGVMEVSSSQQEWWAHWPFGWAQSQPFFSNKGLRVGLKVPAFWSCGQFPWQPVLSLGAFQSHLINQGLGMNNKRHLHGSYRLGNSEGFRSPELENCDWDQIYISYDKSQCHGPSPYPHG